MSRVLRIPIDLDALPDDAYDAITGLALFAFLIAELDTPVPVETLRSAALNQLRACGMEPVDERDCEPEFNYAPP